MRQNKDPKKFPDKVAVALVLCFSVVALTSVFTIRSSIDKLGISQPQTIFDREEDSGSSDDQSVNQRIPTVDSEESESNDDFHSGSTDGDGEFLQFIFPVDGNVVKTHSPEMPIYSQTLNQYMTHEGIDIAASLDSQVKATSAGTITAVIKDDMLGITVEINHGNGFISRYSNLSVDNMVEVGNVIEQGDIISGVGDTSMAEAADEPHVHFELLKDGNHVNPLDYLPAI